MGFLPPVEMTFWSCATFSTGRQVLKFLEVPLNNLSLEYWSNGIMELGSIFHYSR